MGQQPLTRTSVARCRSSVREAGERPGVPLGLGEAVTASLGLCTAVFSILGLEDFSEGSKFSLGGVLGLVLLGHDAPSRFGLA